jgi:galactoside O-acetyltransferase
MLRKLLNACAGAYVRSRTTIIVGRDSRINWLRIGARGGRLLIGSHSIVECRVSFDSAGEVRIGDRSYIGASHLVCHSGIDIGNDVIISWGVTIVDHNSHSIEWARRSSDVERWRHGKKNWDGVAVAPAVIEDKVWIGFGAGILKGFRVGTGAVIGAHSLVSRDVAPFTVVAGNPAKVIREIAPVAPV